MPNDMAPETQHGDAPERQPLRPRVKSEVVWLPAALALLACQVVMLAHGLRTGLPPDVPEVYMASVGLVAASVLLLVFSIAHESQFVKTLALATLALGVAADMFVATSAATGAVSLALAAGVLIVVLWAATWSITDSHAAL